MVYLVLLAALLAFLLGIKLTGLVGQVHIVAADARQALTVIRDVNMSEDEKETAVQSAAVRMFVMFFSIMARVAVAVGVSILLVYLAAWTDLCSMEALEAAATNWIFILATIAITILMWKVIK